MITQSIDTDPKAEEVQIQLLHQATPAKRFALSVHYRKQLLNSPVAPFAAPTPPTAHCGSVRDVGYSLLYWRLGRQFNLWDRSCYDGCGYGCRHSIRACRRIDTVENDPSATEFYFVTAEDIILSKLDWYRMGGGVSQRQWMDVLGILKVQKQALDMPYLEQWAASLRLSDLLQQAFDDAGILPAK